MESPFYRKTRKSSRLRDALRRMTQNRRAVAGVVLGVPLVLFLLFNSRGVVQRIRLERAKVELEESIRKAEEETARLKAESRALDGDTKAVERVAREKYGMAKEGETVYRVKPRD